MAEGWTEEDSERIREILRKEYGDDFEGIPEDIRAMFKELEESIGEVIPGKGDLPLPLPDSPPGGRGGREGMRQQDSPGRGGR